MTKSPSRLSGAVLDNCRASAPRPPLATVTVSTSGAGAGSEIGAADSTLLGFPGTPYLSRDFWRWSCAARFRLLVFQVICLTGNPKSDLRGCVVETIVSAAPVRFDGSSPSVETAEWIEAVSAEASSGARLSCPLIVPAA